MRFSCAVAGVVGAAGVLVCVTCRQPADSSGTGRAITHPGEAQAAAAGLEATCQAVVDGVPPAFVGPFEVKGMAGSAAVSGSKAAHDSTWSGYDWGHLNDTTANLTANYQSFGTLQGFTARGTAWCWHTGRDWLDCGGTPPYTHGCWGGYSGADSLGSQDLAIEFDYQGAHYRDRVSFSLSRTLPISNSSPYPYGSSLYAGTLTTSAGLSFTFP